MANKKHICEQCGASFDTLRGLHLHYYRKHTEAGKRRRTQRGSGQKRGGDKKHTYTPIKTRDNTSDTNTLELTIPCELGGNSFQVVVALHIEASRIVTV